MTFSTSGTIRGNIGVPTSAGQYDPFANLGDLVFIPLMNIKYTKPPSPSERAGVRREKDYFIFINGIIKKNVNLIVRE